jgi:hypothetical protein
MQAKAMAATTRLPKPVIDRIHRYAEEGRVPRVKHEQDGCRLLAVANWQLPVVLLRSTRSDFMQMQTAALAEWTRAARWKRKVIAA